MPEIQGLSLALLKMLLYGGVLVKCKKVFSRKGVRRKSIA
jgi:hypothetical protein